MTITGMPDERLSYEHVLDAEDRVGRSYDTFGMNRLALELAHQSVQKEAVEPYGLMPLPVLEPDPVRLQEDAVELFLGELVPERLVRREDVLLALLHHAVETAEDEEGEGHVAVLAPSERPEEDVIRDLPDEGRLVLEVGGHT